MNINNSKLSNTKTYWSTVTWTLLHTFPKTLSNDFFVENKETILALLYDICISVPCPICSKHAITHLNKYNYFNKMINNTPKELETNIFNFHNTVNKSLSKPIENISILKEYENIDFLEVYKLWNTRYNITTINLRLYNQKQMINNVKVNFINFINKNYNKLNIKHTKIIEIKKGDVQSPIHSSHTNYTLNKNGMGKMAFI